LHRNKIRLITGFRAFTGQDEGALRAWLDQEILPAEIDLPHLLS